MIALFSISVLLFGLVHSKAPETNCTRIANEKCRRAYTQIQTLSSVIPQLQMLHSLAEGCPPEMTDFWQCINGLPAVKQMMSWPGKACCEMAKHRECRKKCSMADSKEAMMKGCRENSESSLFTCVHSQEDGDQCCSKAVGTSCGIVCRGVYLYGVSNLRQIRNILSQHCTDHDKKVETCVLRQWQPQNNNTQRSLLCCDKTQIPGCQSNCRKILNTIMSEDDRIEELIKVCSQPLPTDPMWQCFLTINTGPKRNDTLPMNRIDNAKLQCCSKAFASRCRELCTQTYKKGWSYHSDFESACSYQQPMSIAEANMHNCLTDVDQPCKLGCNNLSFCTNFNRRPTELFRSCTAEADEDAQKTYNTWKKGVIQLSQMTIPVKDIGQCKPAMWKAIACTLEIKPCASHQSIINLCKEDCLNILNMCIDESRLSGEQTVPALCNALPSKTVPGACVSMDQYMTESPFSNREEVTHPCHPNPCAADEVCLVRRRKCKESHSCEPYICHKACPLGQVSKVLVPKGSDIRLANHDTDSNKQEDCYLACHCSSKGVIENCKQLTCMKRNACLMGHDNSKEHGVQFSVDDNKCICNSGKLLCFRKTCQPDNQSPLYQGMPSNCPTNYEPVCGSNGKTYPNSCMAKCTGVFRGIANRACSDEDVCIQKPCPTGTRCVPRPQICLNELPGGFCPQYECVNESGVCNSHHHDPACSANEEEFTNVCLLYAHKATLGYRGHCQTGCSNTGVVCGHDGETYSSECAALAARVTVDYFGKCKAFGNVAGSSTTCIGVECPALHPLGCDGITPPGGCCPICAAQLRILWDPRLMSAAALHSKSRIISAMDVLNSLSDHITVKECDVFGYISIHWELVVIIAPTVQQATALQVEACQGEAERIYNLIHMGSPNIVSYLNLSPLILVTMERSRVNLPYTSNYGSSWDNSNLLDPNKNSAFVPQSCLTHIHCLAVLYILWKVALHLGQS
ncbi:reversion-inducing cysteine-rich protein with Kazal motifs-like isoform X2 [Biomphalaria glabrata]|uniref:Reversion-inducing cysteine-rich protein with Kazal motifs-like isoform X2 n=1 Tax=Biomphalaria glabrata TaxID=6526 RepID=A0A9W2ZE99_BIOGL|nr:reversion-inducing cysteine-rich protein with Kazal motifs-like isoform X2 [Biomphalaria glabrata]